MKLKDVLATLDIDLDLEDGDMVTDLLVIGKVQRLDGPTTIVHAATEGTDGITKLGLATALHAILTNKWEPHEPEDV